MAPARIPLADRFWPKVDRGGPDECWPWLANRRRKGYGRVRLPGAEGGEAAAHRVAWMLTHGEIPDGKWVLHRCDNPPCCNPAHLFLGDHHANEADKDAKQRRPRGERNGAAKLTEADVIELRRRHAEGEGFKRLAKAFGVDKMTVSLAVRGKTWAHVALERTPGAYGY